MGYEGDSFEEMFEPRFVTDVGRDIVDQVGTRLLDRVQDRTPVAELPAAYKGDLESWVEDRGGRPPRTLRDAWRRSEVLGGAGHGLRVTVWNPDPVAPHVEWDTRPHAIRAHMRSGPNGPYQGSLRFPSGPVFRYAVEVWHPGTQGVHMMRDTLAEIEVVWVGIAERVLDVHAAFYDERYA